MHKEWIYEIFRRYRLYIIADINEHKIKSSFKIKMHKTYVDKHPILITIHGRTEEFIRDLVPLRDSIPCLTNYLFELLKTSRNPQQLVHEEDFRSA